MLSDIGSKNILEWKNEVVTSSLLKGGEVFLNPKINLLVEIIKNNLKGGGLYVQSIKI